MTILALDTTSEFGSLAIRRDGQTPAESSLHSPEGFAHLIFPAIEQLLRDSGITLQAIDCFAAAIGPGSFTGVRVGLSAIKGLAHATGKSAAGISNLRALASFGHLPLRAIALDARRSEVYAAVYDADLRHVVPETVLKLQDWLEILTAPGYEFISTAPLALDGTRFAEMPFVHAPKLLAPAIASCAERDAWQDPAAIDANYVRRSDAELFWRDDSVGGK